MIGGDGEERRNMFLFFFDFFIVLCFLFTLVYSRHVMIMIYNVWPLFC